MNFPSWVRDEDLAHIADVSARLTGDAQREALWRDLFPKGRLEKAPERRDQAYHTLYLIGAEDTGRQRKRAYGAFGRERSYLATQLWLDPVFQHSVKLYQASRTTHQMVIISTAHKAVLGYWHVSPQHADLRTYTPDEQARWHRDLHYHLLGKIPPREDLYTYKAILLMDPLYYEGGLRLFLRLYCHSVETPFANKDHAQRLAWLRRELRAWTAPVKKESP